MNLTTTRSRPRSRRTRTTVAAAALILPAILTFSGCAGEPPRSTRTELLLGTTITVTTYGRGLSEAVDEVFARVAEIERKMSTSEEDYSDTELLAVNRAAGVSAATVSADTFAVVREALRYSELSRGAFDVSVHPLVRLWGIGTGNEAVPTPEILESTVALVDYREVVLNEQDLSIMLPKPGMGLDVGGIAKGYAADEAARILVDAGVESALLDFGGNIVTVGRKPDGSLWRIGVQAPDSRRGQFLGIATVENKSVVTSGTYERFFEYEGVRYHHILDTSSGYPVRNGLDSVSIIASDSIAADALSTAVFALGLKEGYRFVERLPEVDAIFVTDERDVYATPGADAIFTLTNEEYQLREL